MLIHEVLDGSATMSLDHVVGMLRHGPRRHHPRRRNGQIQYLYDWNYSYPWMAPTAVNNEWAAEAVEAATLKKARALALQAAKFSPEQVPPKVQEIVALLPAALKRRRDRLTEQKNKRRLWRLGVLRATLCGNA